MRVKNLGVLEGGVLGGQGKEREDRMWCHFILAKIYIKKKSPPRKLNKKSDAKFRN